MFSVAYPCLVSFSLKTFLSKFQKLSLRGFSYSNFYSKDCLLFEPRLTGYLRARYAHIIASAHRSRLSYPLDYRPTKVLSMLYLKTFRAENI